MSDMEDDYDFDYEDDDMEEMDDEEIDIENQYYTAKGMLEEDVQEAITGFKEVLSMEEDKSEWGFRACKQLCKVFFSKECFEETLSWYTKLLGYLDAVTKNKSEKTVGRLLDHVGTSSQTEFLLTFYNLTLDKLKDSSNSRLVFKVQMKLTKVWMAQKLYSKTLRALQNLVQSCDTSDRDTRNASQLLELYAMLLQLHTKMENHREQKSVYEKALKLRVAVPHPLHMGIIHESGGMMFARQAMWQKAAECFFDAFRSLDEAGNIRRIDNLKYMMLCKMLCKDTVDVFEAPEVKAFAQHEEVSTMASLADRYRDGDIEGFQAKLLNAGTIVTGDAFLNGNIEVLLVEIRSKALLIALRPFKRVRFDYLQKALNVSKADVKKLLAILILEGEIDAKIDAVADVIEVAGAADTTRQLAATATIAWQNRLQEITERISSNLS